MTATPDPSPAQEAERPLPARARNRVARVARLLVHFGRRHRGAFLRGCVAAVFVVGARLAMPWPIHSLMRTWQELEIGGGAAATDPAGAGPGGPIALGLAFLALLAAMGLADATLRVQFARFSIGTIRDLRAAALRSALGASAERRRRPGDMVARLVGDTARVKAGLKGFLVHVAPNSLLVLGVTAVLAFRNVLLGLVFGAAGLFVLLATYVGARAMYGTSRKYRKREGQLADRIDSALRAGSVEEEFIAANRSSGRHEAALTRIQSVTTWSVYVTFGLAILAAVAIGTREIARGTLEPRDMVVFLMYALLLRGPTVRLARQGTRLGKTVGTANRIVKVLYRESDAPSGPVAQPAAPPAPPSSVPATASGAVTP